MLAAPKSCLYVHCILTHRLPSGAGVTIFYTLIRNTRGMGNMIDPSRHSSMPAAALGVHSCFFLTTKPALRALWQWFLPARARETIPHDRPDRGSRRDSGLLQCVSENKEGTLRWRRAKNGEHSRTPWRRWLTTTWRYTPIAGSAADLEGMGRRVRPRETYARETTQRGDAKKQRE